MTKYLRRTTIALFCLANAAFAQDAPVPPHMQLARELVATVTPDHNHYNLLRGRGVMLKGDFFISANTVDTHCVGFVTAVLERTKTPAVEVVKSKTHWTGFPRINSYAEAINKELGFKKRNTLSEIQVGDVSVFTCIDGCSASEGQVQGHIMFVNGVPVPADEKAPIIEGTKQWLIEVIDVDEHAHDRDDTRYIILGGKQTTGVGRGHLRLYTDTNDVVIGYRNDLSERYFGNTSRPIIFGQPATK